MSRFTGVDPLGNRVVGLGLSEKTFREMLTGKMLVLDLGQMGIPKARLILVAGKDENELAIRINGKMNEETKIVLPPSSVLRSDKQ